MSTRTRVAALALALSTIPAVTLTGGTAHAAVLCGTLAADYVGFTYETAGGGSRPAELRFESGGRIFQGAFQNGTYTANLQALTLNLPVGTYTSNFRGCDASLTTPAFITLTTTVQGQPSPITLTKTTS
ncbi:hypothetical protein [Streptomyces sp. NPDC051567]|uniref:hypothetical protein n=1 Tax=Streptomyces sp. NPDC051567 TaxID=3365660 RepID=UPI00378BF286